MPRRDPQDEVYQSLIDKCGDLQKNYVEMKSSLKKSSKKSPNSKDIKTESSISEIRHHTPKSIKKYHKMKETSEEQRIDDRRDDEPTPYGMWRSGDKKDCHEDEPTPYGMWRSGDKKYCHENEPTPYGMWRSGDKKDCHEDEPTPYGMWRSGDKKYCHENEPTPYGMWRKIYESAKKAEVKKFEPEFLDLKRKIKELQKRLLNFKSKLQDILQHHLENSEFVDKIYKAHFENKAGCPFNERDDTEKEFKKTNLKSSSSSTSSSSTSSLSYKDFDDLKKLEKLEKVISDKKKKDMSKVGKCPALRGEESSIKTPAKNVEKSQCFKSKYSLIQQNISLVPTQNETNGDQKCPKKRLNKRSLSFPQHESNISSLEDKVDSEIKELEKMRYNILDDFQNKCKNKKPEISSVKIVNINSEPCGKDDDNSVQVKVFLNKKD